jgi:type IV secretion system protein VirB9
MRLYSSANERDYLNRAGFYYPEGIVNEWDQAAREAEKRKAEKEKLVVSELPMLSIDKLDFSYKIEGDDTRFKPLRVFNDGTRVFLQMPDTMKSDEAPVLLLMDKDDQPLLVNYRVKDAYYIVDKLFDRAALVVGTEGNQSKVTITWTKSQKSEWFW